MPVLPGTNLKPGRRKKSEWPPCADCGTPDGPIRKGLRSPIRIKGERFGIDGELCWGCYDRLNKRRLRTAEKSEQGRGTGCTHPESPAECCPEDHSAA